MKIKLRGAQWIAPLRPDRGPGRAVDRAPFEGARSGSRPF